MVGSVLIATPSDGSAQVATGPPTCSEANPEFCVEPDSEVMLESVGRWGEFDVASLELTTTMSPCPDGTAIGCYHEVKRPHVESCYHAIYTADGHEFKPCPVYMLVELQAVMDTPGTLQNLPGCDGKFNSSFVHGGNWFEKAPTLLNCDMTYVSLRNVLTLYGPTYVSVGWSILNCLESGPRALGAGSECIRDEKHTASTWVEVVGPLWDSEPIAACELFQWAPGARYIQFRDRSDRSSGPNIYTNIGTTVALPEGLAWTEHGVSQLVADRPGVYVVTVIAEMYGWGRTDTATCESTVDPWDDPSGGGGPAATCDEQLVTVDLAKGDVPTNGDDVILGTPDADVIDALAGDDLICAEGGDDTVVGGDGADTILGGDGRDILRGGPGADRIFGQDGDDRLLGGIHDDTIHGGEGNDYIGGFGGADTIDGGAGNDTIFGGFGADMISGGPGADSINGLIGNDTIDGGGGSDTISGDAGNDTLRGGPGADIVNGGNAADSVFGDGGDDILGGGKADDQLDGGIGFDVCSGNKHFAGDAAINCENVFGVP